jgi:LuxR family maltose regulon positive regulatory protein
MTAMISDSFRALGKGRRPARSAAEQTSGEIGDICARRRLAQADQLAGAVLTPLLDGPGPDRVWVAAAFLLGAIARDTLGDPQAAERALQHALDLAGSEQVLSPFLSDPSPGPPGRQDQHPRAGGTLIGPAAAVLAGADRPAALPGPPARHLEA